MTSLPPFDDAVRQFRTFLAEHAQSTEIAWIFREDLVCWRGRFFVKTPLPKKSAEFVRTLYESDSAPNFGIQFSAACRLGEWACCYIWRPATAEEAELTWVSGLKLSVPTDLRTAQEVRRDAIWAALNGLRKLSRLPQPFSEFIMSRRDIRLSDK